MPKIILYFLIIIISIENYSAQGCCTVSSNTFGGYERGTASVGQIKIGLGFVENQLNSTYTGTSLIEDPLGRSAAVSVYNFEVEYGLASRVSILLSGGITVKKRETIIFDENNNKEKILFNGNGIGDVTILTKYSLIEPSIISPLGLFIGGGVKLPVGDNNKKNDGARLPLDLQPGTGSTDLFLWGSFYKGFLPIGISFNSSFLYRYNGSNLDGYKFGDEYILSVNANYSPLEFLTASLGIKSRFSKDDFWGGRFLPSTGGTYHDLIPSITYYEGNFELRAFYQVPLYRNVKGIQLTTSAVPGIEILVKFF